MHDAGADFHLLSPRKSRLDVNSPIPKNLDYIGLLEMQSGRICLALECSRVPSCARPSFKKAHADRMAHFSAAD
jgi:hypothetical protein